MELLIGALAVLAAVDALSTLIGELWSPPPGAVIWIMSLAAAGVVVFVRGGDVVDLLAYAGLAALLRALGTAVGFAGDAMSETALRNRMSRRR